MSATAREVVATYIDEVWNKGRTDLVPELCADIVIRHDANSVTQLTMAEQIARIDHNFGTLRPVFDTVILAGDDRDVTLVWNVTGDDPAWRLCGIEIFRVIDGKIREVWNSPYVDGAWGTTVALWDDRHQALPVMSASLAPHAELVVPLDARSIARWLSAMLSPTGSSAIDDRLFAHGFAGAAVSVPIALGCSEAGRPATGFTGHATAVTIAIARSGLANATIALAGEVQSAAPLTAPPRPYPAIERLAHTRGHLGRDLAVSEGTITLLADGSAHGEVMLADEPVPGEATLTLGWHAGDFRLDFTMTVDLGPSQLRTGWVAWRAAHVSAVLVNDVPATA